MKRLLVIFGFLLLFGAARFSFERGLMRDYRAARFHGAELGLPMRQVLGQAGFVAALSGFRSIVADYYWLQSHTAWQSTQWGRMKLLFDAVTTLQPRALLFWDGAAWHMGWNASVAALQDETQPREALRIRAQREYFRLAEDYLLRGIGNNPDRAMLFDRLGLLYSTKMEDHCRAAWAYGEAAKRQDAMGYVHRFAAYELAKCPGHEREAYELLRALYLQGEDERLPTLLRLLKESQIKLNIPEGERIDITADLKKATPR